MSYKREKIKMFKESTLEDYNDSHKIEEVADIQSVEKTDGSFIQIGIRPVLEDDFLIASNFDARLPGLGRMIAAGELDFLVKELIKTVKPIRFGEGLKEFPKYIEFDDAVVLISSKFYAEIFTKLMNRIKYHPERLDERYRIITVPENILQDKIIILGKGAVLWQKQILFDETTGKKESLQFNIAPVPGGKVDITVKTVNKIVSIDESLIKILEVKE